MADAVSSVAAGGGTLCLDFANTWREDASSGYDDLVRWAVDAGVIESRAGERLLREASARPAGADTVTRAASHLARSIRAVFGAAAAGQDPDQVHVDGLNRALARALPRLRIRPGDRCCTWTWSAPDDALDRMLWPIVRSAADLLTSDLLARVRQCASPDCSWLFLDGSRNRQRRWCDMATCGNRAKARRYYRRHRRGVPPRTGS